MTDEPEDSNGGLEELFGDVIYRYTDEQAVADGVLVPFKTGRGDTRHRITRNASATLESHHRQRGYASYTTQDFVRFFFAELTPLIPEARNVYNHGDVLKTTYDFKVIDQSKEILWYLPNELGGITIMLPEDY